MRYRNNEQKIKELMRYQKARSKYMTAKRNLEEVESYIFNISPNIAVTKVQSMPSLDKFADYIDRLRKLRNDCMEEANEALKEMQEVIKIINTVKTPQYHTLLTKRYIHDLSLEEIAEEFNYEYSWITRLHQKALDEVEIGR